MKETVSDEVHELQWGVHSSRWWGGDREHVNNKPWTVDVTQLQCTDCLVQLVVFFL